MEHIKAEQARIVPNSPVCTVLEYEIKDKDINAAVVKIAGRYPSNGWAHNEKCKMLGFILNGKGRIVMEDQAIDLSENDIVLILPGEKYYWEGTMTIMMPATPSWYPGQYKLSAE